MLENYMFQMYSTETQNDGVPVMRRIEHQFSGKQITRQDLMKEFVKFLDACGYE